MAKLEDIMPHELATWLPTTFENYVNERVKAGEDAHAVTRSFDAQHLELFPNDAPADGQFVMDVLVGVVVDTSWMSRPFS